MAESIKQSLIPVLVTAVGCFVMALMLSGRAVAHVTEVDLPEPHLSAFIRRHE